jgi:hypothetical protein
LRHFFGFIEKLQSPEVQVACGFGVGGDFVKELRVLVVTYKVGIVPAKHVGVELDEFLLLNRALVGAKGVGEDQRGFGYASYFSNGGVVAHQFVV